MTNSMSSLCTLTLKLGSILLVLAFYIPEIPLSEDLEGNEAVGSEENFTEMKSKLNFNSFFDEVPVHFVQFSEIISGVKPLLNVSRFFGVPGFSYVDTVVSKGGLCSLLHFWNIVLLINQIFLLIISASNGEDFFKKTSVHIIMRLHVISIHIWSLFYTRKLADALRESPSLESRLKIYKDPESTFSLRRKCYFVTILFVLVSLGLTFKSFFIDTLGKGSSFVEAWNMYSKSNCKLNEGTFFHPSITSAYCLFSSLATNFIWVFGDFLVIILALILAEMFRRLNKGIASMQPEKFSALEIDLVREHHGLASKTVAEYDDAISSLTLINAIFNTAFLVAGSYSFIIGLNKRRGGSQNDNNSNMTIEIMCKLAVAAVKFGFGLISASILHTRAHASISHVRSWPMAREFQDFSVYNGRASVIHAFLAQLSSPNIGFTLSKFATITAKLLAIIAVGVALFFAFARITISSCSRNGRA